MNSDNSITNNELNNKIPYNFGVKIGNVTWQNPVTTASGTFSFALESPNYFDINILGAICLKTITLLPRQGNDGIRVCETPAGMLNSIGLANPGIEIFLNEILPKLKKICKTKIICSIAGNSEEEYTELVKMLSNSIDMIELNLSCPNVKNGCLSFGIDEKLTGSVVESVKKVAKVPIIAKLSPMAFDISKIAKSAENHGADAVSMINTISGMKIDIKTKKSVFNNITAGLSGPAIHPIAVRMVYETRNAIDIQIIAMGGIQNSEDAIEFMLAGADAVAIGTYGFVNPYVYQKIIKEIDEYFSK